MYLALNEDTVWRISSGSPIEVEFISLYGVQQFRIHHVHTLISTPYSASTCGIKPPPIRNIQYGVRSSAGNYRVLSIHMLVSMTVRRPLPLSAICLYPPLPTAHYYMWGCMCSLSVMVGSARGSAPCSGLGE